MSLADELLADFEDDSDGEEEKETLHDALNTTLDLYSNGKATKEGADDMAVDRDDEEDEDEDMSDGDGEPGGEQDSTVDDMEDEDQTKARVEKMQLGQVEDVRNVAGLMKVLEPILEVCIFSPLKACPTFTNRSSTENRTLSNFTNTKSTSRNRRAKSRIPSIGRI